MKAARAMLDWSQDNLAAATGLSVTTICNIESGEKSPRHSTARIIRQIFEKEGLEFTEYEGIRVRSDEVRMLRGPDGYEKLLDDILHTVREKGGDIQAVFFSGEMLGKSGFIERANFKQLKKLSDEAPIKCVITEMPQELTLPFQFKIMPKQYIGGTHYFSYGNKVALLLSSGSSQLCFAVVEGTDLLHSCRRNTRG